MVEQIHLVVTGEVPEKIRAYVDERMAHSVIQDARDFDCEDKMTVVPVDLERYSAYDRKNIPWNLPLPRNTKSTSTTLKDAGKLIKALHKSFVPGKLSSSEETAMYEMSVALHDMIRRHQNTVRKSKFRQEQPELLDTMESVIGKFVWIVDVSLRDEVGHDVYDSKVTPFYVKHIVVSRPQNTVYLHGSYVCHEPDNVWTVAEEEHVPLDELASGKYLITECIVDRATAKYARRNCGPAGCVEVY